METDQEQQAITECLAALANLPPVQPEEGRNFGDIKAEADAWREKLSGIARRMRPLLMQLAPRIPTRQRRQPIEVHSAGHPIRMVTEKTDPEFLAIFDTLQHHGEWKLGNFFSELAAFHGKALSIRNLLQGHSVTLEHTGVVKLEAGTLAEVLPTAVRTRLIAVLFRTFNIQPFPFRHCAESECRTVFVRNGRQLFCSRRCALRSAERKRRGKRGPYMKELMRRRRENEARKAMRLRQKAVRAVVQIRSNKAGRPSA